MEPDEELHSFPYAETIGGVEHNYRITKNDENHGIEKDGVVIAEIAHGEHWQQLLKNLVSAISLAIHRQLARGYHHGINDKYLYLLF
jgi:hypothetical protein